MISHLFVCSALLRPRRAPKPKITPRPTQPKETSQCFHISDANLADFQPEAKEIYASTTSLHHQLKRPFVLQQEGGKETNQNAYSRTRCTLLSHLSSHIVNFVSFLKKTYRISALGKSMLYLVILVCTFAGGLGWFVTNVHLVARAVSAGISQNNAAFLLTLIGIGSLIGRVGHGVIIDKGWISRQVMFTVTFGVTGILSLLNPFLDTYFLLGVFAGLFGLFHGIANSLVFAMMKLQVAKSEAAAALSFGTLVLACANTSGGVLAGKGHQSGQMLFLKKMQNLVRPIKFH